MLLFTVLVSVLLLLLYPAESIDVRLKSEKPGILGEKITFTDKQKVSKYDTEEISQLKKLGNYKTLNRFENLPINIFNVLRDQAKVIWGSNLCNTQGECIWEDTRGKPLNLLYRAPVMQGTPVIKDPKQPFAFTSLAIDPKDNPKNSFFFFTNFVPKFYMDFNIAKNKVQKGLNHVLCAVLLADNTALRYHSNNHYIFPFGTIFSAASSYSLFKDQGYDSPILFAAEQTKVPTTTDPTLTGRTVRDLFLPLLTPNNNPKKRALPEELQPSWTCFSDYYNDTNYCDCDCGIWDPDCDKNASPCAYGAKCQPDGSCPPEPTWNCSLNLYGSGEECDCNCGIWDPDCNNKSLPIVGCHGTCEVDEQQVTYCNSHPVPPKWTCNEEYYNSNDGCDCDCGIWDPDCNTNDLSVFCATFERCDRTTATCVGIPNAPPPGWFCEPNEYNDSHTCHCDCGLQDPDCSKGSLPIENCPFTSMTCSAGFCVGSCDVPGVGTKVLKVRQSEAAVVKGAHLAAIEAFTGSSVAFLSQIIAIFRNLRV